MVAAEVPNVVAPSEVSSLTDEWILLQSQELEFSCDQSMNESEKDATSDEDDDCFRNEDTTSYIRLDHYWKKIFEMKDALGSPKFKILTKLVKALLSLPHGNADCERGFSVNKNLLENRSHLNEISINGLRQMKSYIKRIGGVENLQIKRELLKSVRNAGATYRERKNKEKATRIQKRKIENDENQLDALKKESETLNQQVKSSQSMLSKAEAMITKGLEKKDLFEIQSGQVLLKEAKNNIEKYLKLLDENRKQQLVLSTKKAKKQAK